MNRLTTATYGEGTNISSNANHFTEKVTGYDKNGNLTKDLNKNITGIQYNCLNLPSKVTFGNGNTITYTYAADGTKLRTVHKTGSTTTRLTIAAVWSMKTERRNTC